jgi:hypothetical protein
MRRVTYEEDRALPQSAVRVRGYSGVAFRVMGWRTEPGECEWFDGEEWVYDPEPEPVRTGELVVRMVGDDYLHVVDEGDVEPLARREYCAECGQIGCSHDGYDDDDDDTVEYSPEAIDAARWARYHANGGR